MIIEAVLIDTRIDPSATITTPTVQWSGGRGAFVLSHTVSGSHYKATFIINMAGSEGQSVDLPPVDTDTVATGLSGSPRIVPFDLPSCSMKLMIQNMLGGDQSAYPKIVIVPNP